MLKLCNLPLHVHMYFSVSKWLLSTIRKLKKSIFRFKYTCLYMYHLAEYNILFWHFRRKVLSISSGVDELGSVKWDLALCLLLSWTIVYFCLWKGIKWTGKVSSAFSLLILADFTSLLCETRRTVSWAMHLMIYCMGWFSCTNTPPPPQSLHVALFAYICMVVTFCSSIMHILSHLAYHTCILLKHMPAKLGARYPGTALHLSGISAWTACHVRRCSWRYLVETTAILWHMMYRIKDWFIHLLILSTVWTW